MSFEDLALYPSGRGQPLERLGMRVVHREFRGQSSYTFKVVTTDTV